KTLPRTPETRAQVLDRYYRIVADGSGVFRMLQHNQASVSGLAHAKNRSELFRTRMDALTDLLTEPDAPLGAQLRAAVALASVSFGCMFYADRAASPDELREVVLDIARGLTGAAEPGGASELTRALTRPCGPGGAPGRAPGWRARSPWTPVPRPRRRRSRRSPAAGPRWCAQRPGTACPRRR